VRKAQPDDRFFEPEVETMPRAGIEARQEERILELVPYVYERSALVRRKWEEARVKPGDINSLADFTERVPFITKDDIRQFRDQAHDPFGGLLCTRYAEATTVFSTSGTTGDATLYAHAWDRWHPFWAATARDLWEIGVRPGDYVLGSSFKMRGPLYHADHMCGAIPLMVDTGIGGWAAAVDAIRRYRPAYAVLTSLALAELDHLSRSHDMRELFSSFKGVSFAGEPLGARAREQLKSWDVEVYVWTSTGDVTAAFECREHDGCHAWEDCVLLEAVDPADGGQVADGELGELVATSLDNPVTPMVRFRSDDIIRMTRQPCGCGRTHARFWPVGRKGDETIVAGRSFVPMDIWRALEQVPETATALFQLIRPAREIDELRVRVGYDPETTASVPDLRDRVSEVIQAAVGVPPVLELLPEPELVARGRSGKLPRVVKA
jgi:phenylacetate-CoA ligase